jgi:hypothetical protein
MANNDLLKEAIADAKAVKETAIANAKLALEEAFTPHLKSMLSAKLEEMDKEDVDEGYDKYEEDDVNEEMDSKDDMKEEKEDMDEAKEELDEINLDELLAELELDEDKRTDAEQEGYKDGFEDAKDDLEKELKSMKVSEEMKDKDKDDVKEEMKDKDDVKEDARTDAEEEGYKDGMKDEKEDMMDDMDDEEIDLEDMSENDLKGFIEDVIKDLVADGTIEGGEDFEEEDMEMMDVEDVEDVDVDVEIDEAKDMDKGEKGVGNEDGDRDDSKVEKETEKMRFKEALDEINELKKELNEVNLLNAKLLYTNKVFKSKNLSEDKKVKVLKAFDKASTVKEAKVIFETLNEGLVSKTEAKVRPQGSASKATGTITEAKKQPIIESNDVYNRMRKLAGLI